jgi:hypothetical protein
VRRVSCLTETEIRLYTEVPEIRLSEADMDCLTESDFPASQRRFLRLNETESCLSETTLGWSVPLGWYLRTSDLPTVHENQRSIEERNSV